MYGINLLPFFCHAHQLLANIGSRHKHTVWCSLALEASNYDVSGKNGSITIPTESAIDIGRLPSFVESIDE